MYGYIYKTTDLVTSKIYIGQKKSANFIPTYHGSGKIITRLLLKYGPERFKTELIEECNSFEELNQREIFCIAKFNSRNPDIGYNIASGGTFGDSGYHIGMLGKHQSEYQKQKAREYMLSDKHPLKNPESRKAKSKQMMGNTNAAGGKGLKFIHKGSEQRRVPEHEIHVWLSEGWEIGKADFIRENQSKAYKVKYANGKYINNGKEIKFKSNDELDEWLAKGWKIGRKLSN